MYEEIYKELEAIYDMLGDCPTHTDISNFTYYAVRRGFVAIDFTDEIEIIKFDNKIEISQKVNNLSNHLLTWEEIKKMVLEAKEAINQEAVEIVETVRLYKPV